MSRLIGVNCKKCRKLESKLFLKGNKCFTNCVVDKLSENKPRGKFKRTKLSEYGVRLHEKQKAKFQSGMSEIPFKNLFTKASHLEGQTGEQFLKLLETRLDNIVRRIGFATSLKTARQMVLHGFILVNGKKVTIPSVALKVGDKITLDSSIVENINVKQGLDNAEKRSLRPSFIEYDGSKLTGKLLRWPDRAEMSYPVNEQLIVEHYSK